MKTNKKQYKILYVAPAEKIPGTVGGSVHVEEVARGLGKLGYEVHALIQEKPAFPKEEEIQKGVFLHRKVPKYKSRLFLWRAKKIAKSMTAELSPDFLIERYYNFGGAGVLAAKKYNIPLLLEVNSPVIDHPGSLKKCLDRFMIFQPMKRYRHFMCNVASDIITPLKEILPNHLSPEKVHQITWGAAVEKFSSDKSKNELRETLKLPLKDKILVFIGSFRKWHGVWDLVEAFCDLPEKFREESTLLMIGDGPERKELEQYIKIKKLAESIILTGSIPYEKIPEYLLASDFGIAPYNPAKHKQLGLGFYWSPLKIFEYMAAGLPVITIKIPPLDDIIKDNESGLLYKPGDVKALTSTINVLLATNATKLKKMGDKGYNDVSKKYSWQKHCQDIDNILRKRLKKNG